MHLAMNELGTNGCRFTQAGLAVCLSWLYDADH